MFIHGDPIAKGAWSFPAHSYSEPGYVYFNLSYTGDISTATAIGIVSSDTTGPIYTDNPTIVSPGDGVTHSIPTSGTKYIRAYGEYGGEWSYSSELTFTVQEINFTNISITGGPNYTVNVTAEIVDPVGIIDSCGFYINNNFLGATEQESDPYWGFGDTYSLAVGNTISVSYEYTDVTQDRRLWIRAYFSVDSVFTWSGLVNIVGL